MTTDVTAFLNTYPPAVASLCLDVRQLLLNHLHGIGEELDLPARMVAYTYGRRYVDMVCTIFLSRKGVKLGFYKGTELPDPEGLLEGSGKLSRYVSIKPELLHSEALSCLVDAALNAYHERMK